MIAHKLMATFAAFKRSPFRINEEGWGEFDMGIAFYTSDKSGDQTIAHDLNFGSEHYETKHTLVRSRNLVLIALDISIDKPGLYQIFKNPKAPLLAILKESGPVPGEANGVKSRDESAKKKKRPDKGV